MSPVNNNNNSHNNSHNRRVEFAPTLLDAGMDSEAPAAAAAGGGSGSGGAGGISNTGLWDTETGALLRVVVVLVVGLFRLAIRPGARVSPSDDISACVVTCVCVFPCKFVSLCMEENSCTFCLPWGFWYFDSGNLSLGFHSLGFLGRTIYFQMRYCCVRRTHLCCERVSLTHLASTPYSVYVYRPHAFLLLRWQRWSEPGSILYSAACRLCLNSNVVALVVSCGDQRRPAR